uniref:DNA helicase Pif1-like 2B domain-containing protein n=1 Tax=Cajanus cajan TaxID=3821 RepID=A0A151TAI5_CAJCA|nr:hypothetical protein KK1_018634 [Cajanus cajan]
MGKLIEPNDGYAKIEIPYEFLITNFNDLIDVIVQSTYPNLVQQYKNEDIFQSRAILAQNIEIFDQINDYVLSLILGDEKDEKEYLKLYFVDMLDTIESSPLEAMTLKIINTLKTSGLPKHRIKLKSETTIMLLKNLYQLEALCNRTRLIVTRLANHVIEVKIIS